MNCDEEALFDCGVSDIARAHKRRNIDQDNHESDRSGPSNEASTSGLLPAVIHSDSMSKLASEYINIYLIFQMHFHSYLSRHQVTLHRIPSFHQSSLL